MVLSKKGARAKGITSATEQDDPERFSDEILYTKTEVTKMQEVVKNLAGVFEFKTVDRVHDIHHTYPNSTALMDEYIELASSNMAGQGRTRTSSEFHLRKD